MTSNRRIDTAAILLRTALGVMFIAHALQKYVIFALELVGGIMLIGGIKTRWVASVLSVELIAATWPHLGNGWMFTAKGGGWEYPAFLAVAAATCALLGNGARDDFGDAQP